MKIRLLSAYDAIRLSKRWRGISVKVATNLPEWLHKDMETGALKPRRHPGVIKTPFRSLPENVAKAIDRVIGDTPLKQLLKDGENFNRYLQCRQSSLEEEDIKERRISILKEVEEKLAFDKEKASEEELKHHAEVVRSKVTNILKQRVYNWKNVEYTRHMGLVYLISRGLPEFVVLSRVLSELKQSNPDFQPKSLFDFGSGVGTSIWAAESVWKDTIKEYFCVDTAPQMNDIAEEVLGKSGFNLKEKVFFRQFLPASHERSYDIVMSAYSLMELSDTSTRLKTLLNLWKKTRKYLVLIERGSNAYFKMINEARDFILMNSKNEKKNIQFSHIVAPCPHEFSCPRIETDHTPCNFSVSYDSRYMRGKPSHEVYTYVIIARGQRKKEDEVWPRVVRPVQIRKRHCICNLCTSDGSLQQVIFSPTKPNKEVFRCAKSSKWGDMLPVDIKYITTNVASTSSSEDNDGISTSSSSHYELSSPAEDDSIPSKSVDPAQPVPPAFSVS